MNINNFCPFSHVGLVLAFRLFTIISQVTPFAHQACETNHLLGETESCWEEDSEDVISHCLQPSQCITSQHTLCAWGSRVGIYWALALIGSAKQAAVETRLTWLAATAPILHNTVRSSGFGQVTAVNLLLIHTAWVKHTGVNIYCIAGGVTRQNVCGIMVSCITEIFTG